MGLIGLHLVFVILTWLATFFPRLDFLIAMSYFGLLFYLIVQNRLRSRQVWPLFFGWQIPGLFLTVMSLIFWCYQGTASSNYDFLLQFWHLPFLPFLSLLSYREFFGVSVAYLALYLISPLLVALSLVADYLILPVIAKSQWGYHKERKVNLRFREDYAFHRSGDS